MAEVPDRFDVKIGGSGYLVADVEDLEAEHGYTPTFVDRLNVRGDYGDNAQAFWLAFTQRDWSLGEQLKFARPNDPELASRYFQGTNVDVRTPGQVSMRRAVETLTFSEAVRATYGDRTGFAYAAGATSLFQVDPNGTITNLGAHGLGAEPARNSLVVDSSDAYMSSEEGTSVGVRKWDGASFTTFSADGANSLAFLNNTLFGARQGSSDLVKWDSAGTLSSIFTWKDADGGALGTFPHQLHPFGGDLLALFQNTVLGPELWLYDGVAPAKIASLPHNSVSSETAVVAGTAFISAVYVRKESAGTFAVRPAV